MNKKFIFGILILGVLITSFVSAGLFSKVTITGNVVSEGWTDWFDRDNPSGAGDYEILNSLLAGGAICENGERPTGIECRRVYDKKDSSETGQNVTCDLDYGFYCLNKLNAREGFLGASCNDYEVRYYCGDENYASCVEGEFCNISVGETKTILLEGKKYLVTLEGFSSSTSALGYSARISMNGERKTFTQGQTKIYQFGSTEITFYVDMFQRLGDDGSGEIQIKIIEGECLSNFDCASGEICSNKECVDENVCTDTCSSMGYKCGSVCGVSCGICSPGEVCSSGNCVSSISEVTYQGVLDMLSSCESQRGVLTNISSEITGNDICGNIGKHCLMTFEAGHYKTVQGISVKMEDFSVSGIGEDCDYRWMLSTSAFYQGADHMSIQTICCSAP